MINEFSSLVKPSNCKAKVTFWVLIALSAVNVVAYILMDVYNVQKHGLVGVLALGMITAAVFVYTKYISPKYYYDITFDYEGTAVFVVRQVNGKRASTLCRISLHDIASIKKETVAERRSHKTPFSTKKYNYVPTLFPADTYRVTTRSRYEAAEILLEISDEFAELLLTYVAEAKAILLEKEEEEKW